MALDLRPVRTSQDLARFIDVPWRIDRASGALVVVRPDQYVAHVLPLDAHQELAAFFGGFMTPN